jgi:voltage-dependent potassium channel beta subunit
MGAEDKKRKRMKYRRLGRSGLQVSVLSFGSWVTFDTQIKDDLAMECMQAAKDAGCNFFDNAEAYAGGESEAIMGRAVRELGWKRQEYVITSKFFWGIDGRMVNMQNTLNRKYLIHAVNASLERMGLDFLDVVYCHRPDPNTPIEETVWALSDLIDQGKALYWGTSEWSADEIRAAWEIAERHHLHKPVVEQPQYHLFHRKRVEQEYARLYDDIGIGLTTWSPLASGLLTGKYKNGIPPGSRGAMESMSFLAKSLTDTTKAQAVARFEGIAAELGCTVGQLAIAWVAKNPHVSSVITGASKLSQLQSNLGAVDVIAKLTPEVMAAIDEISAPLAQ